MAATRSAAQGPGAGHDGHRRLSACSSAAAPPDAATAAARPPRGPSGRATRGRRPTAPATSPSRSPSSSLRPGSDPGGVRRLRRPGRPVRGSNTRTSIDGPGVQLDGPDLHGRPRRRHPAGRLHHPVHRRQGPHRAGPARRHRRARRARCPTPTSSTPTCWSTARTPTARSSRVPTPGVRHVADLQPRPVHAGRPRPGQAADDLGRGPGGRQGHRREDRPAGYAQMAREHRRLAAHDRRPTRAAAGWRGRRRRQGHRDAQQRRAPRPPSSSSRPCAGTDNSMGSNFVFDWGTINQAFAAGQIGMYTGGSDVYTAMVQNNSSTPADYGLTIIPLDRRPERRRPRRWHARGRQRQHDRGPARRGRRLDRLLLHAEAARPGRRGRRRQDPRGQRAAGRHARPADLRQGHLRPVPGVDQGLHQRPARPDDRLHRAASSTSRSSPSPRSTPRSCTRPSTRSCRPS